jgi:fumarate reductase flavoprotein subunit
VHFADTVRGSDWGADQRVVRMFAETAPKAIRELAAWGVPWNRVQRGPHEVVINGERVTLVEDDAAHGLITARNFGGTAHWRANYVSDGTGHSMLYTMSDRAVAESIPVHERMEAMALICEGERCHGVVARNLMNGELVAYVARATCIATGGFGRIYRVSTNAVINEGMGAAIALESGVACLGNMEAVQFHPTGIFPAGILVTEGCRGDGGLLLDGNEHRFMPDYEPEKMELASRDVVSRRMEEHIRAGHGYAAASASTCGWISGSSARHISTRACARSRRSASISWVSTRRVNWFPCARRSTTRWAAYARIIAAPHRVCRACSPPVRRPAGTCTASIASVATPSPRRWSRA